MPRKQFSIPVADLAKPERSLTPAKVRAAVDVPERGQRIYWLDGVGLVGVGLLVRPPTAAHQFNATWVVMADDPRGVGTRLKVARFGDMPVPEMLKRAQELRGAIQAGTHRERKHQARATADRNAFTVGDAFRVWVQHLEQHRRPSTLRDAVGRDGTADDITAGKLKAGYILLHFGDWLGRPLASLTEDDLAERHAHISKVAGRITANRVLRALRAAWSKARGRRKDLPPNLLRGTDEDRGFSWNEETPGGEVIPWGDLPGWWAKVHELPAVRRDWNLVALFTAARRDDVKRMRWEHVDLERGTVHFPEPKGGPKKAYTIPVASFVLDVLRARREENKLLFGDDRGWVFPIEHRTQGVTYLRQPLERRYEGSKKVRVLPSPHMLRRTWITAADGRITRKQAELLANHGGDRNVHGRYVIPDEDALREAAEKVAGFLLEKVGALGAVHDIRARTG